jgi:hypothetical protein
MFLGLTDSPTRRARAEVTVPDGPLAESGRIKIGRSATYPGGRGLDKGANRGRGPQPSAHVRSWLNVYFRPGAGRPCPVRSALSTHSPGH